MHIYLTINSKIVLYKETRRDEIEDFNLSEKHYKYILILLHKMSDMKSHFRSKIVSVEALPT